MNENQTPQPDYNFIMNQPEPGQPANDGAPKKKNKKVIVLIILVVLTAILGLVVVLFPNKKSGNNPSNSVAIQENPTKTSQEQTVRQFLNDLKAGNYEAAYSLLATNVTLGEETGIQKDWFVQMQAPALIKFIQASPCVVTTPDEASPNTIQSYCLSPDKTQGITHTYEISKNNGINSIESMKIKEIINQ